MSKVNHDIRSNDGGTIYHLPENDGAEGQGNLELPNVYESDASALYPVGTKFVDGERVFHYSYAGNDITDTLLGLVGHKVRTQQAQASYTTSQPAGAGTIANPFKIAGTATLTPAKNAYAGQYILILQASSIGRITMRIVSNTQGLAAAPYTTELVLDQPTPVAVAGSTGCDIHPNRYADVRYPVILTAGIYPFLGVNLINVASGRYFWLQTWGPCFISVNNTYPGQLAHDRTVTFRDDGSLGLLDEDIGNSQNNQIVGYTLSADRQGSSWTMLMCDR